MELNTVRIVLLAGALALAASCGAAAADPGEVVGRAAVDVGGVDAIRIRYGSIGVDGDPARIGALVMVPEGTPPPGGWPIVAYAHGTTGSADGCAPSRDPELAGVGAALTALAGAGFVAIATDYEGIGTGGDHPYLHGPSEARAIADSVRAVRALVPETSTRWAALGYSQGGHAALFAAELAGEVVPDLPLVGVAVQAPAVDPAALAGQGGPPTVALLANGWLAVDPELDEDDVLTEAGRDAVDAVDDVCAPDVGDPLVAPEAQEAFDAYVAGNLAGTRQLPVPVFVAQGTADPLVHREDVRAAADRLCAAGSTVELRTYRGVDHLEIVEASTADVLAWLADRFGGRAPGSTC